MEIVTPLTPDQMVEIEWCNTDWFKEWLRLANLQDVSACYDTLQ